jgi:cell wall-associated NlpC family hydrolase
MEFDKKKSDEIAQSLLGMKFRMGTRGADNETDCYGVLVIYYREFGIQLPDYSIAEDWDMKEELYLRDYATMMRKLDPDEEPKIGDMILFKNVVDCANHAAIYLGDNKFIHAYPKAGTRIDSFTTPIWKRKMYGIFRLKE